MISAQKHIKMSRHLIKYIALNIVELFKKETVCHGRGFNSKPGL